jgi:hypothetical protein
MVILCEIWPMLGAMVLMIIPTTWICLLLLVKPQAKAIQFFKKPYSSG